jgi:hypothetical protein
MNLINNPNILKTLKSKAKKSTCTYKVAAIAFDKKGDILGTASNSHSEWDVLSRGNGEGRAGTGKHAERILIKRYGNLIKTILICRVGHSGEIRHLDSCSTCKKVAKKFNINIISVFPGSK